MKSVYVVTRTVEKNFKDWGIEIPNLGVHTQEKKAQNHLKSVIENRLGFHKAKVLADTTWTGKERREADRNVTLRKVILQYDSRSNPDHKIEETVYLERWKV
jgi:hypothetical protein